MTVESYLRVHLVPFFKDRGIDRIGEAEVMGRWGTSALELSDSIS